MKKISASNRSISVEYAIRDVVLPARELEKKGIKVIKLNIGDPVKYDFDAPEHAKTAYCEAIKEGHNYYSDSEGIKQLREAIAERENRKNNVGISADDVFVTAAVTEALQITIGALTDPGDEILVPGPTYPPYISFTKFMLANPIEYQTKENEGWIPDVDDMRKKITEKTKAIVIINPNNPTGAVYDEKTIKEIIDLAGEYGVPIISDEIYDLITYDKKHVSPSALSKDVPVIVFNGMSKVYFATGWRLGYMYLVDREGVLEEVREAIGKLLRVRLCPSTPAQYAAIKALTGPMDYLERYLKKLRKRRDLIYKRLAEMDHISVQKPEGAFYIFPKVDIQKGPWKNDKEFVLDLLKEKHVLVVHGSGFGNAGKDHFRAVYLPEESVLEEAMNRLEEFLKERIG